MDRKVLTIIIAASLVIVAIAAFVALNAHIFNPMAGVTNMQLAYGSQTIMGIDIGGSTPILSFSVSNSYNSYLTIVGLSVDGINRGQQVLQIPPGQTQSVSIALSSVALSSGASYQIELTFTFADGKYETHSESCSAPQFVGTAQITASSLTVKSGIFGGGLTSFHIEIENAGNLPITNAKCYIEGYNWELSLVTLGMPLLSGKTASTGWSGIMSGHEVGKTYSVSIPITFQDGSTTTLRTNVLAQSSD